MESHTHDEKLCPSLQFRFATDERGFTVLELIVACLIISLLAAIAIPALLGRRNNASDAVAKGLINTAEQTAQSYVLSYGPQTMSPAALKAIEPTINTTANGKAVLVNATPTSTGYILTVVSSSADTYYLTSANGRLTRTCLVASGNGNVSTNTGGGCRAGTW